MELPQDLVASNVEIKNNGVTQDIAKGLRVLNKNIAKMAPVSGTVTHVFVFKPGFHGLVDHEVNASTSTIELFTVLVTNGYVLHKDNTAVEQSTINAIPIGGNIYIEYEKFKSVTDGIIGGTSNVKSIKTHCHIVKISDTEFYINDGGLDRLLA